MEGEEVYPLSLSGEIACLSWTSEMVTANHMIDELGQKLYQSQKMCKELPLTIGNILK